MSEDKGKSIYSPDRSLSPFSDLLLEEDFEHIIDLKDKVYIGSQILSKLDEIFTNARKQGIKKGTVVIKLYNTNLQLNLSIISFIALKAQQLHGKESGIRIIMDVRSLSPGNPVLFKLKQYAAFCYIFCTGSILELHDKNGQMVYSPDRAEGWLEISRKYLPAFMIDRHATQVFNQLFKGKTDIANIEEHWSEKRGYSNQREEIIRLGIMDVDTYTCILSSLAFLELAAHTVALLKESYGGEKLRVSLMKEMEASNNYSIMIFSILLIQNTKQLAKITSASDLKSRLEALLLFARTQARGIQEIAQNVIEHSSSGRGVLTGRFFLGKELLGMYEGDRDVESFVNSYGEVHGDVSETGFFQIQLIDESEKGILDTYNRNETAGVLPGEGKISSLSAVYNIFRDSDSPGLASCLKSFARIGLVSFQRMVLRSEGFFSVHTLRDQKPHSFAQYGSHEEEGMCTTYLSGTSYNVIIPQLVSLDDSQQVPIAQFRKIDGESMHDLFSYYFIAENKELEGIDYTYGDRLVVEINIPDIHASDRIKYDYEKRVVSHAESVIANVAHVKNEKIWLLNFSRSASSGSIDYVVRIIAGILERTEITQLIILNTELTVLEELIDLLRKGRSFLDPTVSLLFFPKKGPSSMPSPFPVLVAGESYAQFIQINRQYANINLDKGIPEATIAFTSIFINEKAHKLLEFDVVIEIDGLTLFEQYALERLNQEIM